MARVIVTGAGIGGLTTALLLGRDGHEVTVLERDPAPPPASADAAWAGWERRGVNQFRLLHFFLARFRAILEAELPEVVDALESAGALRLNFLRMVPDAVSGGYREGDDAYELLAGRRPVMEAAMARVADASAGVRIERGTAVAGLLTGRPVDGVPRVVGVRTETGTDLAADLVVDTTGRRSPLPSWLEAIGAPAPMEEREDSGFVYYGRHFRSTDGTLPPSFGPNLQHYESISFLTLPADNGTWGVGIVTSAGRLQLNPPS